MKYLTKLHSDAISRRSWLKGLGVLGAALASAPLTFSAPVASGRGSTKRAIRLAHITDIHVQPERGATQGFIKCLHHIQSQKDAPGLILNTGDSIMDSMHRKEPRTRLQWDLWNKILREECSIPSEHAIGNHDCWGIDRLKSGTTGTEPLWGKNWAMDALGLKKPYRSFNRYGWHFIVLDSVEPFENGYKACLGAEQIAWLKEDLRTTPSAMPVLVMSHIPIVSVGGMLNSAQANEDRNLVVKGGSMHLDSTDIHALLRDHGNVKLCLSGHLHIIDRAEYDGVTYISSGAVSSGWWKAVHLGRFDYGYALVDLFEDGSFEYAYQAYGWQTQTPAE